MSIRTVCFDLGGVIVRICHSFVEAAAAAGLPHLDDPSLTEPDAIARRRELILAHQVGAMTFAEYCTAMSSAIGSHYSPEQVRRLHGAWLIEEYPGVLDLLTELRAKRGLRVACLSNTNDGHWDQMHDSPGIFRAFAQLELRLASHVMRLAKPDLAIYRAAVTELGCQPGEVLFFDDLPENIAAAREAGWHAERIDPLGDTAAQMRGHLRAHRVLSSQA
jgi:glucose-1-phosphatase